MSAPLLLSNINPSDFNDKQRKALDNYNFQLNLILLGQGATGSRFLQSIFSRIIVDASGEVVTQNGEVVFK